MRNLIMTLGLAVSLAPPLYAQPNQNHQSSLREAIRMELPKFGFRNVDVSELKTIQVAQLHHILFSNNDTSAIHGQIKSVLGESVLNRFLNKNK